MSTPDPQRIKKITEKVIGLPTLPTVVSKMIDMVDNPKTSAGSLAGLISTDQALTARILKLANSAYYGFSREISTVNMAIVVMGFNSVKEMGLSLSVFDMFKDLPDSESFDISQYWQHSIGCGVAAKLMTKKYRHNLAGETFVAGLLHDAGKVILHQYMPKEYSEIQRLHKDNADLISVENEILGADHGQIGSWLSDKWRLPVSISDIINNHHSPWESKHDPVLSAIVSVADYLCYYSHTGNSGRTVSPVIDDRTWEIIEAHGLPLMEENLDELEAEFLLELDKMDTMSTLME